jgi:OFA family oxalate/formate antiporter-like MFS transporter
MNKWIVLTAGIIIQTILGGIYAWSSFVPSLKYDYGLTNSECGMIFGAMIATFSIAMIPAGRLLKKFPPAFIAGTGAILFLSGYVLASFSQGNFYLLLLSLSLICGTGIGFGYVVPLTVGMKWFPDHKGLITGVSVAGFGLGALLLSFFVDYLLNTLHFNVLYIFRLTGLIFGSIAIISALFMSEPEQDKNRIDDTGKIELMPYLKSGLFWLICLGMFAGTFAGLITISKLKPLALSYGLSDNFAVWVISVFALGNATGRILWGRIHDKFNSNKTIIMSLLFLGLSLIPLFFKLSAASSLIFTFISGIGFGSCFVVYASSIVQYYGIDCFPRLYPVCFLGYGLAGLTGPAVGGWIVDLSGFYGSAILLSISIVLIALIIIAFGLNNIRLPSKGN